MVILEGYLHFGDFGQPKGTVSVLELQLCVLDPAYCGDIFVVEADSALNLDFAQPVGLGKVLLLLHQHRSSHLYFVIPEHTHILNPILLRPFVPGLVGHLPNEILETTQEGLVSLILRNDVALLFE